MAYAGYCIVRDSDGNVKFDNWNNIPKEYWLQLTEADKAFIQTKRGN